MDDFNPGNQGTPEQQPMYQPPQPPVYQQPPVMPKPPASGLAIGSLVCGIASVALCWWAMSDSWR